MSFFVHFPRIARWLGRAADDTSQASIESAAKFPERRAAVVAMIDDSSLSPRMKADLVQIAVECSRLVELNERVVDIVVYLLDLWNSGGEDGRELLRLSTRIKITAVLALIEDSALPTPCKQRLIAAVGEGEAVSGWRGRILTTLAGLEVTGKDAAEVNRLARQLAALS